MSPRIQYDLDRFRHLVKSGYTKKEIMAEMAIKYIATFNNLKLKLMETDGKYFTVKGSTKKVAKVLKTTIGKNSTLTLSAKILEDTDFQAGDSFNIKVAKNKIILTLIED